MNRVENSMRAGIDMRPMIGPDDEADEQVDARPEPAADDVAEHEPPARVARDRDDHADEHETDDRQELDRHDLDLRGRSPSIGGAAAGACATAATGVTRNAIRPVSSPPTDYGESALLAHVRRPERAGRTESPPRAALETSTSARIVITYGQRLEELGRDAAQDPARLERERDARRTRRRSRRRSGTRSAARTRR